MPFVCGTYKRCAVLALWKAISRSMPNDTATVMFWVLARSGLKAALSWCSGFQSLESRYQLKRVPAVDGSILKYWHRRC